MKSSKENREYIQRNSSKRLEELKEEKNKHSVMEIVHHDKIEFDYVNWKGKKSKRQAEVDEYCFGSTEFHPEPQWLLNAYDLEKNALRTFALKDMSNIKRI